MIGITKDSFVQAVQQNIPDDLENVMNMNLQPPHAPIDSFHDGQAAVFDNSHLCRMDAAAQQHLRRLATRDAVRCADDARPDKLDPEKAAKPGQVKMPDPVIEPREKMLEHPPQRGRSAFRGRMEDDHR